MMRDVCCNGPIAPWRTAGTPKAAVSPTTNPTTPPTAFPMPDCSVSAVGMAEWISRSELPGVSCRIFPGGSPAFTRSVAARSAAEGELKIPTTVFIFASRTRHPKNSKNHASEMCDRARRCRGGGLRPVRISGGPGDGKSQAGDAAGTVRAVFESERAAVGLGDLSRENQPDARAFGLCREEGNEEVRGVREARPFVADPDLEARRRGCNALPSHFDAAGALQGGVHGIAEEIDDGLLKLVRVGADRQGRPGL